jgi:8-oxo-dGTP diphosphatase
MKRSQFSASTRLFMSKPYKLSVKAVILDSERRCLLIRRSPANHNFVGKWEWPGGKVDAGEDFATAVVRETREETGLEVEITDLAGVTSFEMPVGQIVVLCMEARVLSGEIHLSEEHDDFAWVPLKEFSSWNLLDHNKSLMLEYASSKGTQP